MTDKRLAGRHHLCYRIEVDTGPKAPHTRRQRSNVALAPSLHVKARGAGAGRVHMLEGAARALGELSAFVAAGAAPAELPALAVRTLRQPLGAATAALWLREAEATPRGRTPGGHAPRRHAPDGRGEPPLRLAAQEGEAPDLLPSLTVLSAESDHPAWRAVHHGRVLVLPRTVQGVQGMAPRAGHGRPGAGQTMAAPLRAGGRVLGALVLTLDETPAVPADVRAFVEAVAAQVATALEHARLLAESRAQATRAALLADLATVLGGSLDATTLVTTLITRTAEALQGSAAVYLVGDGDGELAVSAVHHPDPAILALINKELVRTPPQPGVGVFGQAYAERRALLVRFDDPDLSPEQRVYAERVGARSSIAVPLLAHDRTLGVLSVSSFGGGRLYDRDDLALATAIAALAAQALDNARSYAMAQEDHRRLAVTFDSMVDAVFLYDHDGAVIDLNEAALRLLNMPSRAEAIGPDADHLRYVELCHLDGRPFSKEDRPSLRAVRGEMVVGFEEIVRTLSSGDERYVIINATPIRGDDGISGAVLVCHDVTELRAAERVKDEFLSVASHELKTPLTPLKGFVQVLDSMVARAEQGVPLDHARARRYLQLMRGRVDRLVELVGAMLDLSRLQTGPFVLDVAPVDLTALVAQVLSEFEAELAVEGQVRHRLLLDADGPVIARCDAQRVEQVVMNLVANALKYSPQGGAVRVHVGREETQAVLTVQDEGIGIPDGEEATLFQPFARGSNAPALEYAGVGLGLYICREIVERHGGSISVLRDHAHPTRGACIRVTLPLDSSH